MRIAHPGDQLVSQGTSFDRGTDRDCSFTSTNANYDAYETLLKQSPVRRGHPTFYQDLGTPKSRKPESHLTSGHR